MVLILRGKIQSRLKLLAEHDCRVASVKQLKFSLCTLATSSARSMADITLSPLPRPDGSATFTSNGYSVIAAVNGPIEVQRRDELPEEAAIDVAVRPAAGVGGKGCCCSNQIRQACC